MHLLFVFLDGVGLGPPTLRNPLSTRSWSALERLAGDQPWTAPLRPVSSDSHVVRAIDATLGVDGLPQSGTGQATLFTGVNCAEHVGRHFGPYPHSATHDILREKNLFRRIDAVADPLEGQSHPATFANAYPPRFFEWVNGRGRWTVTTFSAVESGLNLRSDEELLQGRAVAANITGEGWPNPSSGVSAVSETTAADHLVDLHRHHRVTLFEYYLTDKAGHGRLDVPPEAIVRSVDAFLGGVLDGLDPGRDCLLITSDHGNIEDVSQKQHTRHPVPLIAWGRGAEAFDGVRSLAGVTPAVETWVRHHATSAG